MPFFKNSKTAKSPNGMSISDFISVERFQVSVQKDLCGKVFTQEMKRSENEPYRVSSL